MSRRVVITGLGLCTPVGNGVKDFWRNLRSGRSGIGPISLFDARSLPVRIGGEVKQLDYRKLSARFPELAREPDRKVWLGMEAAAQALDDARLKTDQLRGAVLSVGVCLEVFLIENVAPVADAQDLGLALARRALEQPGGFQLQTPLDSLTQRLGERYHLDGGRYTNCSACAAGAQAVGEAFRRVREREAEIAVAGAADSTLNPLGLGGFSLLHILSTENDTPERACRPFDATRQGTVLSEGAAFVVLEAREHAVGRGARIYAEVLGYGSSMDAYRATDPEPEGRGAALSMSKAIADAGLKPGDIDSINAHGTGTPKNDVTETLAIKRVLGARAHQIPVTANKSMTGHTIAASGGIEAIASVLMLSEGQVPPTINLEHPDPQCDLDYVAGGCREFTGQTVLSNSFGFGGQNASLVFRKTRS